VAAGSLIDAINEGVTPQGSKFMKMLASPFFIARIWIKTGIHFE
jgi:hypothetical protein